MPFGPIAEPAPSRSRPATADRKPFHMALRTNILYDAVTVPNIGIEFNLGSGWTIGASWMHAWWKNDRAHNYWRNYGGELDIRKYFGKRAERKPLTGHHLGLYMQALTYDVELGGRGYMGGKPGGTIFDKASYGIGIEYGYSLPIARRLNLDFGIGIGYLGGEYRVYDPSDTHYVWKETRHRHWFGPTKAEVSLVWLIGKVTAIRRKEANDEKGYSPYYRSRRLCCPVHARTRELCYDHTHTVDVEVVFDWKNAPDAAPETMSLYLFSEGGRFAAALRIHRPPRRYDSGADGRLRRFGAEQRHRAALFRNMGRRETFETYTRAEADLLATLRVHSDDAPRAEGTQDERVVAEPDMLWCDDAEGIELEREVAGQTVTLFPSRSVRRYTVEIRNAENLKYVKGLSGSLSGMARGLLLDGKVPTDEAATIPFAAAPTQDLTGITGGLFAFGPSSQRDGVHKLVIYAVLENGEKWYYTYDVTQQVREAPDPYDVHILLDGLPLPKPLVSGGGFRPGVEGWNEIFIDIIL